MIPNCMGCQEEYSMAVEYVSRGYHVATMIDREFVDNKHLCVLLVDDRGSEELW